VNSRAQIFPADALLGKASPIAQDILEPIMNSVIRIGKSATGSAVIIGKTPGGQEIFVTAKHNLAFIGQEKIEVRLPLLGQVTDTVYHGHINYVPENDLEFAVGVIDSKGLGSYSQIASAEPKVGENAMLLGYPLLHLDPTDIEKTRFSKDVQAFSAGRILSDKEALEIFESLPGNLKSFNPGTQFLIEAQADYGMSGGAVINLSGRLLGIIEASTALTVKGHFYSIANRAQRIFENIKTQSNLRSCRGFFGPL
jgi:S1-C subfamily serine protease